MPTYTPNPDDRGFTLIEMLVVLAILSIVSIAAVQQWGSRSNLFARTTAKAQLTQAIVAAHQRATAGGHIEALNLSGIVPRAVLVPTLPSGDASNGLLRFYPDGSSNGGTVSVGQTPVLAVEWLTGEVHDAPRR